MLRRLMFVGIAVVGSFGIDVGVHQFRPAGLDLISTADARVGRPLTPMSVAGVTRRTVRRCAVGIYYC